MRVYIFVNIICEKLYGVKCFSEVLREKIECILQPSKNFSYFSKGAFASASKEIETFCLCPSRCEK